MTRAFLTSEASARFSQARIDAIRTIGELASKRDAQFIVVAGDVFESNQLSRETLARAVEALRNLPVPVFLLPGNHDPLDGSSIFRAREFMQAPAHVHVLEDMQPVEVPGVAGVEVVGAPWRSKRPSSDLCSDLAESLEPAQGVLRVAVAHGQVDGLSPGTSRPDIINTSAAEQAIEEGRFHYLGLGDRHSLTQVGKSGRIWYSGAPVATDFDEVDPNKALIVDLAEDGECTVEPLVVGNWSFVVDEHPINGADDVERFRAWLEALPDKECTAVKVGFKGSVNLATAAALDEFIDASAAKFASLRRHERTSDLAIVPDDLDTDSVELSGYAKDTWNELVLCAGDGDEVARDALMLLYRLSVRDANR